MLARTCLRAMAPGPSNSVTCAFGTAASRRGHASSSTHPHTGPRIAPLDRNVLELSGPDAQKFLKGLSCKDVESTGGGYSGFLNASGRVLHTVFIHPNGPQRYLISHQSSPDHPAPLPKLLAPFRLRSKVRIKDVTADWAAWSAWSEDVGEPSPRRIWKLGSGGAAESHWEWESLRPAGAGPEEVTCWDLRAGFGARGMGRQILVPRGREPALLSTHDLATAGDYDLHRMLLGVPEGPAEIVPTSALPLESCMDIHGGVDFRKGCYLGQELTVRTYHTGMTRKRILPIRLIPLNAAETPLREFLTPSSSTPPVSLSKPEPVDLVYHPPASSASQKTRSAGSILSLHPAVTSVGLALVRLEMAERCWWSGDIASGTVGEWLSSGVGRLTAAIGGAEWGIYVDKGEAYAAALDQVDA